MHKLFVTSLLLLFSAQIMAQEPVPAEPAEEEKGIFLENPPAEWKQKLHYGGNIWLGFFGAFYVDVSPMIGYEITPKGTIAGLGGSLIYQGGFRQGGQVAVGPRFFVRQAIWRSVFAHAEYELMNATKDRFYSYVPPTTSSNAKIGRKWEGSPLIGAGFYQGRTRQQRGSFISVMYNLGYPKRGFVSPQGLGGNQSPWVLRFGFFF